MAQDIRAMLEAKRGLLLAVSHKLVTGGEAREALLRDLGAMRDLIGDLLESERLAADHAALQRERCSLNALAREVVDGAFAGAALQLQLQLDPTLPDAMLDPARIRLLLRDLIDNALRHGGPDAAPPCVTTSAAGGRLRLVVRDRGPGVDPTRPAQLGKAFHHADAARQRSTGGVGPVLYLCRAVARAHGGELRLRNVSPGLEATVELAPQAAGGAHHRPRRRTPAAVTRRSTPGGRGDTLRQPPRAPRRGRGWPAARQ